MGKHNELARTAVKQRLNKWAKLHENPRSNFDYDDETTPEVSLADKARSKLLHKPTGRRKPKVWYLEFQWIDKKSYSRYSSSLFCDLFPYDEEWRRNRYGFKFITLAGAQHHFSTLRPTHYWDLVSGRHWRIRNIETGVIYTLIENKE